MAELAELQERVDGHDAKFDSLFALMDAIIRDAGLGHDNPSRPDGRRGRHLQLVKGGQP
jgi:hypothetical protein